MDDSELLHTIEQLVNEEHTLLQMEAAGDMEEEKRQRMRQIEVKLDQCWDLLRQRRARREFHLNPDEAQVRNPEIVEHYQQ